MLCAHKQNTPFLFKIRTDCQERYCSDLRYRYKILKQFLITLINNRDNVCLGPDRERRFAATSDLGKI